MSDPEILLRARQVAAQVAVGCTVSPSCAGGLVIRGAGIACHLQFPDVSRLPAWCRGVQAAPRATSAAPRVAPMRAADVAAWRSLIAAWLTKRHGEPFSVADVTLEALGLQAATAAQRHRVGRLLRDLGYRQRSFQTDAGAARRWTSKGTP